MKKFHISDILTILTGKMVSIRNMEGVYDILNYMTDDNLHTHQIPRVLDEVKPYLIDQFPGFLSIDISDISEDNLINRIELIEKEYGSYFEVERLPNGIHEFINPIAEEVINQINKDKEKQD